MLPAIFESEHTFRVDYFDKIQFLNSDKTRDASTEQHNRNNQEIYRLKFIEDTIIQNIREK